MPTCHFHVAISRNTGTAEIPHFWLAARREVPSKWKYMAKVCHRVQEAAFDSFEKLWPTLHAEDVCRRFAASTRVDEQGSTTLTREGSFPWGNINPRPRMNISLAIGETASNPILKNHERIPHQLLMKVADYPHRFYTCNMHQKLVMMFQYDVPVMVFMLF